MENQHRKIKGYRELDEQEIELMNRVKTLGIEIGKLADDISRIKDIDGRWVAVGKTDLQKGLMALTRSIAKPDFF